MATISAPNLVLLRTNINRVTPYLSVLRPSILLSAQVDGLHARGARTIAYDSGSSSSFSTIEAGQTVWFYTSDGIVRSRIKSITGVASSGSFEIDENGIGPLADNTVLEIYHNYEIVPIPPVIRSQIFYKFFDLVFVDQTIEPPPVAIIGSHLAGFLSAGSIVFQLNSSSSYAIADGASISSRVWSCVHMGGGTTGITFTPNTTTANPTLTLTIAGQYWLKCVVTDSNGNSQSTYRAIFVYDSSNLPYKDFSIQSLTGDWASGGWRATIVPFGDVTLDEFPDRTLCLLWYVSYFNASSTFVDLWDINADNVILGGYIRQDNDTDQFTDGTGSVSFDVTTPESVIDNISELGSVSLNAVSNPDVWWEYADWMTTGRAIHHLIKYHSYGILQVWDVLGLDEDTRGVLNTDFTEGSLLQQINGLAFNRGIYAKMACDRFGRLHLVKDSNILNDAGRAALDTVMTIAEADVSGVVTLVRDPEEQIAFGELNGFSFNGSVSTPFISILPGYRESSVSYIMPNLRGSGTLSVGNQILSSQTDSNERIGRVLAQTNNNPRELRFTTPYNGLGAFDIVNSIGWYVWGMADDDLKRNTELNGRQLLCRSITHTFNHPAGTVQTELAFEPEAFGPDGIQGNYPTSYPVTTPPEPDWTPPDIEYGDLVVIWNDDGSPGASVGRVLVVQFTPGLTPGSSQDITGSNVVTRPAVTSLGLTSCVFVWQSNAGTGTALVATKSGTALTPGTANTFGPAGTLTLPAICTLSPTQILVAYADSGVGKAIILDIDVGGLTFTEGTPATFDASTVTGIAVTRLSSTKAIVSYIDTGNADKITTCVLDVSGSTITPASPQALTDTGFTAASPTTGIAALDSTNAIITYKVVTTGLLKAVALTGITTSGTEGTPITVDPTDAAFDNFAGYPIITLIDTNKVSVAYQAGPIAGDYVIKAAIITNSSGTLTAGTPQALSAATFGYDEYPGIARVSASQAMVIYGNTGEQIVSSFGISGTNVSDNNDDETIDAFSCRWGGVTQFRTWTD